jgi:predicted dehydrogenase
VCPWKGGVAAAGWRSIAYRLEVPGYRLTQKEGAVKLRAAVIGTGAMGRHHARILAASPDAELVAVVDRDPERVAAVANAYGVLACADLTELPAIDLAVVAVPTHAHVAVALALIERGIHILV